MVYSWIQEGKEIQKKKKKSWENGSKPKGPDRVEQRLHVYIPIESGSVQSVRNFLFYFILSNYGTWSHLERVSYSVGAPSTLSFLQPSLHQIQIALIDGRILFSFLFFNSFIHTSLVFFLYNLLSLPFFDTLHILSSTSIVHSSSLLSSLLLPFAPLCTHSLFPYNVSVSLVSVLGV